MRLFQSILFVSIIGVFGWGCTSEPEEETTTEPRSSINIKPEQPATTLSETEDDDKIKEFGRILKIEDSGYPRFIVTVEFPERQFKEDYNFNVEESPMNTTDLDAIIGKYATLYYTSELITDMVDIQFKGKSILGEYAPETLDGLTPITGILGKAESPTTSDLPGSITLTHKDGYVIDFEYYITDEMVAVNGKEVTIYYYKRGVQTIQRMVVSKEN